MSEFLRSDGYGYAYRQFNAEACRAAFKEAEAMRETNEKYKLETPTGVAYGAYSVNRIAAALDRVSQKSHMAETIKVEGCGQTDGEWVRRSDYYREVQQMRGEIMGLEMRVTDLACELSAAREERDDARRMLELRWQVAGTKQPPISINLNTDDPVSAGPKRLATERVEGLERCEQENAALRCQLALAESKRKPARHRPGDQVSVGWDPEGD